MSTYSKNQNPNNLDIRDRLKQKNEKTAAALLAIQEAFEEEKKLAVKNKPLEEALYKEYVRCNKNKEYIDIDHINNLGIAYDVLIIVSVKNTGKTSNIVYKLWKQYIKENKKFIFMRSSVSELSDSIPHLNDSENNPVEFKPKNKIIKAFCKKTGEECGIAISFKTCNRGSGGEFKNYAGIFYDECLTWDANKTLNDGHYFNWAALASSVTRNKKKGIKIYCTGNLVGGNMKLLNFYGISPDDNLRYIQRYDKNNPENVCNILYINVNDIYSGINKQVGATKGARPDIADQLNKNKSNIDNLLIIGDSIWDLLEPYSGFIFIARDTKLKIFVEIRKTPYNPYKPDINIYAVKCVEWHPFTISKGPIYTDNQLILNSANNLTFIDNILFELAFIKECITTGDLYCCDPETHALILLMLKNLDNKNLYELGF